MLETRGSIRGRPKATFLQTERAQTPKKLKATTTKKLIQDEPMEVDPTTLELASTDILADSHKNIVGYKESMEVFKNY